MTDSEIKKISWFFSGAEPDPSLCASLRDFLFREVHLADTERLVEIANLILDVEERDG